MGWFFIIFMGGGVLFGMGVGGRFEKNVGYGYGLVLLYERCGLAQKGWWGYGGV